LTIHLLGATGREFLAMPCFEEISHLLPSLNNLAFTMVSPSSWMINHGPQDYVPQQDLPGCPSCKTKARKRTLSSYKGLYHDYAKSSFYKRPDLIVAFNSGCVDGDDADSDWDKTIRLIVNNSVPALFTTYNAREAQHERAKMIGLGAKFVVEPGENKWRSLAPMPEYLDEEYEMWYQNHHRYIIQGKQK
jgi:splicing suppressor protein 51